MKTLNSHSPLDFVIPLNCLLVRRRHASLSALPSRLLLLLALRWRRHSAISPLLLLRTSSIDTLATAGLVLLPRALAIGLMVHIVIGDAAVLALVVGHGLVLVIVGFGVEGDDVPGVEEAGDVAEGTEEDVDEAVGGADAGFDPDGYGGEEDGEQAEKDVAAAHVFFY